MNWKTMVVGETATEGVLLKKVFLKISQISQENTCVGDFFFNKVY